MGKCVKSDAVPPQMLDSALLHLSPSADGAAKASLDKHGLQPRYDDDDDRESAFLVILTIKNGYQNNTKKLGIPDPPPLFRKYS